MSVNAREETFEHIELFGKPALFTDSRIDRATVPDGFYCYDLRGSDYDPGKPIMVENSVMVNHAGTVLTADPVKFKAGTDDRRRISGKLNFLGECLDLAGFCEEHGLTLPPDNRKFVLRPASPDEVGLFYSQEEKDAELGTVGHLRPDFGRGGNERALDIFVQLELIEILDTGAIYMLDIQNYIGQTTTDADRKREYRTRIESEKTRNIAASDKCPDKTPPEIRDKRLENRRIKNTAPKGVDGEYTNSGELLPVLPLFFDAYEKHTGHKHPKISESKLQEITARLKEYGADGDYPEDWVTAYFGTDGRKGLCGASDCSVFHFSSEGVLSLVLARVVGGIY